MYVCVHRRRVLYTKPVVEKKSASIAHVHIDHKENHFGNITFSVTLEEESDDQNLKTCHSDHHAHLDQTEVEDSLFRAPHRAEVAVLPGPEILLHPADRAQLSTDLVNHIFEGGMLFGRRSGLLREQG